MPVQPRIIKACNLTLGTWYNNKDIVPPNNQSVLCCDVDGYMWFDQYIDNTWSEQKFFFWQSVAKPLDFMFD